ncbi:hypothetical protein HY025_02005 [Candidatus Daviesbacteria bacterium]|nr:hypothetical protein [Candidatus Daviesbacteria bacterium]
MRRNLERPRPPQTTQFSNHPLRNRLLGALAILGVLTSGTLIIGYEVGLQNHLTNSTSRPKPNRLSRTVTATIEPQYLQEQYVDVQSPGSEFNPQLIHVIETQVAAIPTNIPTSK